MWEREREESGETVEVRLYISIFFRVIVYFPLLYISINLHRKIELRLEKWVETLVLLDEIIESRVQSLFLKKLKSLCSLKEACTEKESF